MKDIDRLTLEEKVGQLFFLGFQGHEPDANTRALLELVRPGGIVLSQRNLESFEQISRLTTQFVDGSGIPALIGICHEGGTVDRLKQLFAPLPPMREVAQGGGATQTRVVAKIIASQLEATGFNTAFTPVLDLAAPQSILGDRTLSASANEVCRLGAVFVEEFTGRGILACGKHFPGLGAAQIDPHFALPKIDKPKRQLLQEDLRPFVSLIGDLPLMMVGHAYYPGLGDERPLPASLSRRIVEGLLRKKLGYAGVIVTDDMTMGAVNSLGLTPELFLHAFEAGNDMLQFSQSTPLVEQAFRTITRAARQSAPLRRRLDQSVERILAAKQKIRLTPVRYRSQMRQRILRQIEKLAGEGVIRYSATPPKSH